jgi:hypothetical protein
MSIICNKISESIVYDCENRPLVGIEQRLVLINENDLDRAAITFGVFYPNALMTKIALKPGKTGYEITGIKQIMNFTNSLVSDEASEDGVKHSITGIKINDPSEKIRNEINKYIGGSKVYAVLARKWKGQDNKYAFLFFGLHYGLSITELKDESVGGAMQISLSTPGSMKEPYLPHIYRDTDYPTSLTAFENNFVSLGGIFDETFDETFE